MKIIQEAPKMTKRYSTPWCWNKLCHTCSCNEVKSNCQQDCERTGVSSASWDFRAVSWRWRGSDDDDRASASDLCEVWSSDVYSRTQDENTATGSPQHKRVVHRWTVLISYPLLRRNRDTSDHWLKYSMLQ